MLISDYQWAMSREHFDTLCSQHNKNAIGQIVTERYKGLSTTILNGIGYIHVYGTILPRENFMTYFGYGTDIESLKNDLITLRDNPQVRAIVLNIDSSGGVLSGVADFAALVRSVIKPTYSFAQKALSAAYWIAASTNKIILTPTGVAGSIGVILSLVKNSDSNVIDIVSSQSENKNIDPTSDVGKAQLQKLVDDQANVFVTTMASYRNTTVEKVLSDFGRGAVFAADEAKNRGMVDNVQPLPAFLSSLETQNNRRVFAMADQNEKTVANAVDVTAEVTKEVSRIKEIESLNEMFTSHSSSVREKIRNEIDRLKYDKSYTKATVSEHLLKVVAESQKEFFAAETADRKDSLTLSKETTPPTMPVPKTLESDAKPKVDLGEALIKARKQRIAAMNGGNYNVN
jgi:ClpP class serine protease